jgi:hypothetical protein
LRRSFGTWPQALTPFSTKATRLDRIECQPRGCELTSGEKTVVIIENEKHKFGFDVTPGQHILFITIGMAITRIQNFEGLVAVILCSLETSEEEITMDNVDDYVAKFDDKTLGYLVRLMKNKVAGEDLHAKLVHVRDRRNYIAHHALRDYSGLNEDQLIERALQIETIIEEIDNVQKLLIRELSAQGITHISSVTIDEETGEIVWDDENEHDSPV